MTTPSTRCASCNEPHTYDDTRGWRHPDGHAYRPTTDTYPPLHAVADADATARAVGDKWQRVPGYTTVLFGALVKCRRCRSLFDADVADLTYHRNACRDGDEPTTTGGAA